MSAQARSYQYEKICDFDRNLVVFEIPYFDQELKLEQMWSQNCNVPDFYDIWHLEQIEDVNCEYINWS